MALSENIHFVKGSVGPGLTEFQIDQMAFSQSERTCLSIQNVPLLWNHVDSVNPKFGQSGVYQGKYHGLTMELAMELFS